MTQEHVPGPLFPIPHGFKRVHAGDKIPDGAVSVRKDSGRWNPKPCAIMAGYTVLPEHTNWYFRPIVQESEYTPSQPGVAPLEYRPLSFGEKIDAEVEVWQSGAGPWVQAMSLSFCPEVFTAECHAMRRPIPAPVDPAPVPLLEDGELISAYRDQCMSSSRLADQIAARKALESRLSSLRESVAGLTAENESINSCFSQACAERDRLEAERDALRKALELISEDVFEGLTADPTEKGWRMIAQEIQTHVDATLTPNPTKEAQ